MTLAPRFRRYPPPPTLGCCADDALIVACCDMPGKRDKCMTGERELLRDTGAGALEGGDECGEILPVASALSRLRGPLAPAMDLFIVRLCSAL